MRKLFQWTMAAALICGISFAAASCSRDDNAVIDPADGPGAAYRAMLQGLDWGPDTTFVYGHKLPDVDAEPFHVSITPNPARGQMTITTDYDKGKASVVIINPQGIKVRGFSVKGSTTVDVSDLPSGIYFVHVIGGKVVTRKVMIQN